MKQIQLAWKSATPQTSNSKWVKCLWKFAFYFYGLDICNGNVSRTRKVVIATLASTQSIVLLHQMFSIFYTIFVEAAIAKLSFYATILVTAFMSVSSLWVMYTKRVAMAKFLNETIESIKNSNDLTELWRYGSLTAVGVFVLSVVETCCAVSDVIQQEDDMIGNYSAVYFAGHRFARRIWFPRVVISVEFFVVLFISSVFVNISVGLFSFECHAIYFHFYRLNLKFEKVLDDARGLHSVDLADYRRQHQSICKITEELGLLWSPMVVFWLMGFILSICFDLRALWLGNSVLFMIGYTLDFLRLMWLLIWMFRMASLVNCEAHRLADKIVTYNISKPSNGICDTDIMDYYVNYLLLSDRLISTKVGITASGWFLLNASSFISMVGTVLTYVIVLYQST